MRPDSAGMTITTTVIMVVIAIIIMRMMILIIIDVILIIIIHELPEAPRLYTMLLATSLGACR